MMKKVKNKTFSACFSDRCITNTLSELRLVPLPSIQTAKRKNAQRNLFIFERKSESQVKEEEDGGRLHNAPQAR